MYQAVLTRKYLVAKVMPLLAALAVMLCTAMVLITWSVMGGFIQMLLASGRTMVGDVSITWPNAGFAYYDELIRRLEADEAVAAATPQIETFGLAAFQDGRVEGVSIRAVDGPSYARVVDYAEALWWKPIVRPGPRDHKGIDPRLDPSERAALERVFDDGLTLSEVDPETGRRVSAAVPGIEMTGLSRRLPELVYVPANRGRPTETGQVEMTRVWAPTSTITISLLPLTSAGRTIDVQTQKFPVANEFRSGIFEIDRRSVLLDLATVQAMLRMNEADRLEPGVPLPDALEVGGEGGEAFPVVRTSGRAPARVTQVLVRGREGINPEALKERVKAVYRGFAADFAGRVPPANLMMEANQQIATWEDSNAQLVGAVRKETVMVLMLLTIISGVAAVLILAIFWAMVSEKTKDIGVLRALGAGRAGVAWLWVRYGIAIGVLGSAMGGVLAGLIVININPIHAWLGARMGIAVWDPKVYYFSEIPNELDPVRVAVVLTLGVVFSTAGALVPALRAAFMDPVRALRFE